MLRSVIEVVESFVFATKCEVVPFWVETICISYGKYRGYIYLSKSPDLARCPTDVGQLSNSGWSSVQRALAKRPTSNYSVELRGITCTEGGVCDIWSSEP